MPTYEVCVGDMIRAADREFYVAGVEFREYDNRVEGLKTLMLVIKCEEIVEDLSRSEVEDG